MTINIGVVGCGYWGPNLIRNFHLLPTAMLHTCCDKDTKKLENIKKQYNYVNTTADYKDIISNKDITAVVIATPVATHYGLAKEALLAGKHVFLEKPLTDSVNTSAELVELAKKQGLVLMVDHTFEYMPAIAKIKELVEKGELGKIYYAHAQWLSHGLLQPDVNVIWDLAPHVFSILMHTLNVKPVSLSASTGLYVRDSIPEVANISASFENGIKSYITVSWLEPCKTRRLTLVGNKKMLVFDMLNTTEQIKVYDKGVDIVNDSDKVRIAYRAGDIWSPLVEGKEALGIGCAHFIDCIESGKQPISSGEAGLNVVKLLTAADESASTGKEVIIK